MTAATHWSGPVMVAGNSRALCTRCRTSYPEQGPVTDADRWADHHASSAHPGVSAPTAAPEQGALL